MLKENYLYDQKNNLVEIITFYNKTNQKVSHIYQYDKKGNWVERKEFINNKPKFKEERKIEYYH